MGRKKAISLVKRPGRLDEATTRRQRLDFAKVCVKIMADQEIKYDIQINIGRITTFKVEYLWVPSRCSECCKFGNDTLQCMSRE